MSEPDRKLDALGESLRDALGPGPSPARLEAQARRLSSSTRRRPLLPLAATAGTVAVAVAVLLMTQLDANKPQVAPPPTAKAAAVPARIMRFEDGSTLRWSSEGGLARMRDEAGERRLALRRGRLDAEITPGGKRRWVFEAGPWRVEVLGTAFVVEWAPARGQLQVAVTRGRVAVRGPGLSQPKTLDAGERFDSAARRSAGAARKPAPVARRVAVADPIRRAQRTPRPATSPAPVPAPDWRVAARAGVFAEALVQLDAETIEGVLTEGRDADRLLLADTARLGGRPALARRALEALYTKGEDAALRAMAAFRLGSSTGEAHWLEASVQLDPEGPLAGEARRLLERAR